MSQRVGEKRGDSDLGLFDRIEPNTGVLRPDGIEARYDVPFVAAMSLREKQIQQNYRPIIGVHKWFARRPGTLFRALLLAEFGEGRLRDEFFLPHSLSGIHIADPFMGGGTPLIEANRMGCDVVGCDINPMAWWIVSREIERIDLDAYRKQAAQVLTALEADVGDLYKTRCEFCGDDVAWVKYFLWVKVQRCTSCGQDFDVFPGYLVAESDRHTSNVLVCAACGALVETPSLRTPGSCPHCGTELAVQGPARRGNCPCPHCGSANSVPATGAGVPRHRMFAIEYHCDRCRPLHRGRFFKRPDDRDIGRYSRAERQLETTQRRFSPSEPIPEGDETSRLLRWGYRQWRDLFNARQAVGLESLCGYVAPISDARVRNALATNVSDVLRYQNMLCRYDTRALKSLDVFSVHGFPVGLVACESNLLGIRHASTGATVGSGGWLNVVDKYVRAKEYCEHPFEVRHEGGHKKVVVVEGEWIGENTRPGSRPRAVDLRCADARKLDLLPKSLDAVLTDPPYFANVQYGELMDFCYHWLKRLVDGQEPALGATTTRNPGELTGNATQSRGIEEFTAGLSEVFSRMAAALKPGAPLVFTYHHNSFDAYIPVGVALLDASMVCTASLPAPAEMGGSIHIHGTGSSVVDTVLVCRTTGRIPRALLVKRPSDIASLVLADLANLEAADLRPTRGDARCITYGHLIRLAVWECHLGWDHRAKWEDKLSFVRGAATASGGWPAVEEHLPRDMPTVRRQPAEVRTANGAYCALEDGDVVEF